MYSKGPWRIEENCIKAEGRCVARMDWDIRDEVDDANANLIVEAPNMLAMLENLRERGFTMANIALLDRVISRAKGL